MVRWWTGTAICTGGWGHQCADTNLRQQLAELRNRRGLDRQLPAHLIDGVRRDARGPTEPARVARAIRRGRCRLRNQPQPRQPQPPRPCCAPVTTAAARSSAPVGDSPASIASATTCRSAGLRAMYPSPSSYSRPMLHARDKSPFDVEMDGMSLSSCSEVKASGASSPSRPIVSSSPARRAARRPAPKRRRDRGWQRSSSPGPADGRCLRAAARGTRRKADPTHPGGRMEDLPGLVLPDRPYGCARPDRQLLYAETVVQARRLLVLQHP